MDANKRHKAIQRMAQQNRQRQTKYLLALANAWEPGNYSDSIKALEGKELTLAIYRLQTALIYRRDAANCAPAQARLMMAEAAQLLAASGVVKEP